MDKLRVASPVVLAITILSACGSGSSSSASTGPGADAGGIPDSGTPLSDAGTTVACTPSLAGTCSNGGAFCGAIGCCPAGGGSFACASTGKCYATQAEAQIACGASCVACASGGGVPDGGVSDGGSATCAQAQCTCPPGSGPYACESTRTCYATQAAAQAACSTNCLICTGGGGADGGADAGSGGSCNPAPQGTCSQSGFVYCGGTVCCPGDFPFDCPATKACYKTEAGAAADCPNNTCVACGAGGGGTDGGSGATCAEAPSGQCSGAGYVYCGGTDCCPVDFPYTCGSSPDCFKTPEEARAACRDDPCLHCH